MGLIWLASACLSSCTAASTDQAPLTREELLKPESCKDCHPKYFREWSGSMHAYAMKDPIYIAMNKRGQEETGGQLGNFCNNCHAPMAVREGAITSPADLSAVPEHLQGVTCYFCHNAVSVGADHFNATSIALANDTVMRADLHNPPPVEPTAHRVQRSELHNGRSMMSSTLCGSCHDIITPNGYHLERTFAEYLPSLVAQQNSSFQSCQSCHMDSSAETEQVAVFTGREGELVSRRDAHEHFWPAVDVALTDGFPYADAMRAAVENCELPNSITFFNVSKSSPFTFQVQIETQAGHNQPSGAAHDRRMWLEIYAYDASGTEVFRYGVVNDGEVEEKPEAPHPFMLRDRIRDANGQEVHMFWDAVEQATPLEKDHYTLPPSVVGGEIRHYLNREFRMMGATPAVRYVMRLRMRPVGRDVLDDLVRTGHLDPSIAARVPTFTVQEREYQTSPDTQAFTLVSVSPGSCHEYRCLLDPQSRSCTSAGAQAAATVPAATSP